MTDSRTSMAEGLKKSTQQSYATKDNVYKTYLDQVKLNGTPIYSIPEKISIFDIIPYQAGNMDPHNKPGEWTYHLDVNVHMRIGGGQENVVCLEQYGKKCPICENIREMKEQGLDYKEQIKPLVAKRRCVYNIIVRINPEQEAKGLQILEMAHFFLEKNIIETSKDPITGGYRIFSDPDIKVGAMVSFVRTGKGATDTNYSAYRLLDRQKGVTDAEMDSALVLDSLLEIKTYEEAFEILNAFAPEYDETQSSPTYTGPNVGKSSEFQEEVLKENVVSNVVSNKEPDGFTEPVTEVVKEEQEKVQEEKPPAVAKKAAGKRKVVIPECPIDGGVFGVSIDEYEECDTCSLMAACSDMFKANNTK